jgi:hypothetical protein
MSMGGRKSYNHPSIGFPCSQNLAHILYKDNAYLKFNRCISMPCSGIINISNLTMGEAQ